MKLRALIGCEYSGIVRDAFENAGWDAWSCDLLPTESEQTAAAGKHFEGDVLEFLYTKDRAATNRIPRRFPLTEDFDLLIGHPPCTYLSFAYTGKERYSNTRLQQKIDAYQFFLDLWNAPIEHICLENPMGYIHTGLLPYTQIIEPYYFGHDYKKKTCLWLKNLPKLQYCLGDNLFEKKTAKKPTHRIMGSMMPHHKLPLYNTRHTIKEKSKFHSAIANAMAEQWTEYIKSKEL